MLFQSQPLPNYLVIGHVTKDLYPGGYKIGGTATFSALTARNLGHQARIVTCCGPDIDLSCLPDDVQIEVGQDQKTTTFENVYLGGHRRQFIRARARSLTVDDVPTAWQAGGIVHLGPVDQEVDERLADHFAGALIGLTPQGWMRSWDAQGVVSPIAWTPSDALLARADAVILSQEDVGGDWAVVEALACRTRLVVLTAGWQGATVYTAGQVRSFEAPTVQEIDPTGAGDIFAAAFLSALAQTHDPWLSAQFANCVASRSVERSGLDSIPTRDEIARCRALFHLV